MNKLHEDIHIPIKNKLNGDGSGIIEILNIGFEPLLTFQENRYYLQRVKYKRSYEKHKRNIKKLFDMIWENDNANLILLEIIEEKELLCDKYKKFYQYYESKLKKEMSKNINLTRKVNMIRDVEYPDQRRHIAIFESDLIRVFGCLDRAYSDTIVSVVTYYTEIFKSIFDNGFTINGEKFVFFTAGAGQTRNKKSTFVKEEYLLKYRDSLFCGLSEDIINSKGGMNTNKYMAYTSLCQSNTEVWQGFDIDRAIVVDDIEFDLKPQLVRYINVETNEDRKYTDDIKHKISEVTKKIKDIKGTKGYTKITKELRAEKKALKKDLDEKINTYYSIEEKNMNVTIPFTDGFGLILARENTSMVRLPFIKGLMSYAPYSEFKRKYGLKSCKITDIYGKTYNIDTDKIKYIFTKSQFKMWKYYDSWDEYKKNFKKYNCAACRCNVETDVKLNAKTNYQVLQTLTTEMTDEDILTLAEKDLYNLENIGSDYKCMLDILGATEKTHNPSYLQQALMIYPEMLRDSYVKNQLLSKKESMIKRMYSGKFDVNGAYTFIIPDVLACMEWWFLGKRDLDDLGFVKEGYVSCSLFNDEEKLDCLRSPHLDHAHCIRKNKVDENTRKWAKSKGVYVGVKDNMSKLLMYDNDGDTMLVHNNKTIIDCAERFQEKYPMIPSYYEMAKAEPQEINKENLFNGIVLAYHHGNIGTPSNDITGIWRNLSINSTKEDVEMAIESIAIKTAMVNFTIDYAKTLWKPEVPKNVAVQLNICGSKKVPHFFQYAKDKLPNQCEPLGDGCIDRIQKLVPNKRVTFKDVLGGYSYKNLINEDVDINSEEAKRVVDTYFEIHNNKKLLYRDIIDTSDSEDENKKTRAKFELVSERIKKDMSEGTDVDENYIVNTLVKALKNEISKSTLWDVYGDIIIKNIKNNLPENTKLCDVCGERFEYNKFDSKKELCDECYSIKRREDVRNNVKKSRKNRV